MRKLIFIISIALALTSCKTLEIRAGVSLKGGEYDGWAIGASNQGRKHED